MNIELVSNLRQKLSKRVERLHKAKGQGLHFSLIRFLKFLTSSPVIAGILNDLSQRYYSLEIEATKVVDDFRIIIAEGEDENAALALLVIKKCVASIDSTRELTIGRRYGFEDPTNNFEVSFYNNFIQPLHDYIDEQLDDERAFLSLLVRYKHKCEWFQREKLFKKWGGKSSPGEKGLGCHLFEYLHDQGLDISVEPVSISGRADMVAIQDSDDPIIADTKIFNIEKNQGTSYIAKGFGQIYRYTLDYNKPFGYLIIYKTSDDDLKINLSHQEYSVPFVVYDNKTIFITVIDIFPHEKSASQRGKLNPVELKESDLIQEAIAIKAKSADIEDRRAIDSSQSAVRDMTLETSIRFINQLSSNPKHNDLLIDALDDERGFVYSLLNSERFTVAVTGVTDETFQKRMHSYESLIEPMMAFLSSIAFYNPMNTREYFNACLKILLPQSKILGNQEMLDLRYYPFLLSTYAAGIVALSKNNYINLKAILLGSDYKDPESGETLKWIELINPKRTFRNYNLIPHINDKKGTCSPSEYLQQYLYSKIEGYFSSKEQYEEIFDIFEYLLALNLIDITENAAFPMLGRFVYHYDVHDLKDDEFWPYTVLGKYTKEGLEKKGDWELLTAGFFAGTVVRFISAFDKYRETLKEVGHQRLYTNR